MTDKQKKEEIKQVVTNLGNIEFTVEDELKFCKEVLKRKEQECERLKEENFTFEQLIKEIEKYGAIEEIIQQLDQLKAENELLKINNAQFIKDNEFLAKRNSKLKAKNEILEKDKTNLDVIIETLKAQFNQLKEENDELKTEFDKLEEQIKLQENFIDSFLFATKNSEWLNKSILEDEADAIIEKIELDYVQLENYKQALQEIKEIAEKVKNFYEELGKCENLTVVQLKQILQKCEVINEQN